MTDYQIPCDTFARLATLTTGDQGPWFRCVRYDRGALVATDRQFLAAEHIGNMPGAFYIIPDPVLVDQCRKEAEHGGIMTITVIPELKWASAKTMFGYEHPGNVVEWSDAPDPDFSRWRVPLMQCKDRPAPDGVLFINLAGLIKLTATAPSGSIVFEEAVTMSGRPTLVRDPQDPNWVGMFQPWGKFDDGQRFSPATLPAWLDQ